MILPLLQSEGTPESIALGVAIGLFIALTPTVGIQMTLVLVVGTLINRYTRWQMNRLVGIAMCWVSNPLTMLPMYYGYLWLGWIVTGRGWMPPVSMESWQRQFSSYLQRDPKMMGFWEKLQSFVMAGLGELAIPMWVGSLIIATLLLVPSYLFTLRAVRAHRLRREKRIQDEAATS